MIKTVSTYVFLYLSLSTSFGQNLESPPGNLFDVGGYQIHMICEGEGGPPVVMFHGAGDIALHWNLVVPGLAQFTKAIAVDQAGEGWSKHGHGIHMWQQAYDTRTALKMAGIKPPYVLVGHSLGGMLTRVFAQMYPDDVAGVVLVDATHPDVVLKIYEGGKPTWKRMRETSRKRIIPGVIMDPLSTPPELKAFQPKRDFGDQLRKFSREDQRRFQWIYNERPYTYVKGRSSYEAETMQLLYENSEEYDFGNKPLVVISKGIWTDKEGDSNWSNEQLRDESVRLQKELLKLSSNSRQVIAKQSGHQIHLDQPELIVEVVRQMILQLRENK